MSNEGCKWQTDTQICGREGGHSGEHYPIDKLMTDSDIEMKECKHVHLIRLANQFLASASTSGAVLYKCQDCKQIVVFSLVERLGIKVNTPPTLATEVIKHRNEYPKEASDRWFASTSTTADIVDLVLWELAECMYSSEPDAPKNGLSVDSWHASACALRCYAMILRLKDKLDASSTPPASPVDSVLPGVARPSWEKGSGFTDTELPPAPNGGCAEEKET